MKNVICIMFSWLFLVGVAHAGILNLDENNIKDDFLTQDGITYRILDDRIFTIDYINDGFIQYRRVIVENYDEVISLEKRIRNVFLAIDHLNAQIKNLETQTTEAEEEKAAIQSELESLKQERDMYKAELDELTARKNELENSLTGNLLVSPQTYQVGMAVFILLVVATIIVKARQYMQKE